MCSKDLAQLARRCPTCKADLDLLVDYAGFMQGGLERAENLTRAGELGEAVWAYLEVLSVDPDNAAARKQVSKVVTAVRQFDQAQVPFAIAGENSDASKARLTLWVKTLAIALVLVITSFSSFFLGYTAHEGGSLNAPPATKKSPIIIPKGPATLSGK